MKAKHFRKMRTQITNRQFINLHIDDVKRTLKQLHKFKRFECCAFFRGSVLADLNQQEYNREYDKTIARLKYLQKRLKDCTD